MRHEGLSDLETISDLAPSLTAAGIPRYFAGDGLTQVISHVVSEAGGEAELGAGRGGEGAGAQEEAQARGDKVHDVTEVPGDWSPSPSGDLFIISTCHVPLPPSTRSQMRSLELDSCF